MARYKTRRSGSKCILTRNVTSQKIFEFPKVYQNIIELQNIEGAEGKGEVLRHYIGVD